MSAKPLFFISIFCLVILAACTPPAAVSNAGSAGSGSSNGSAAGSGASGAETGTSAPSPTPAPSDTPSAGGPEVSTTVPGAAATPPAQGGGSETSGTVITPGPDGNLSVTLADAGKTIQLKVGERFLLNLGEGYDWSPEMVDQSVISRVPNIAVIRGAQGIYEAHKAGTTTLNVTGDPTCRKSKPPCGMASRAVHFIIEVQ